MATRFGGILTERRRNVCWSVGDRSAIGRVGAAEALTYRPVPRPPEDVGGVSGYERFLDIIADPGDPEFEETMRWCGGHFDPEWFDLAMTDKDLRNALRSNAKRRLYQPKPKTAPKK